VVLSPNSYNLLDLLQLSARKTTSSRNRSPFPDPLKGTSLNYKPHYSVHINANSIWVTRAKLVSTALLLNSFPAELPGSCLLPKLPAFEPGQTLFPLLGPIKLYAKQLRLSHTWGADAEEVTFEDLTNGTGKDKPGYEKIHFCRQQAKQDGLEYFWVDTCCINKANYTELSQAINSMFRWYYNVAQCYIYLLDVSSPAFDTNEESNPQLWESDFQKSRWFTRGWTL
jgi:hypothetical protein